MTATPLVIGPAELAALAALRERAAARPVDMPRLMEAIKTRAGKARHKAQMTEQSVRLPVGFMVTFSIETGHPVGSCRHMSMSSGNPGRVPGPEAVMMAAEPLGFVGGLEACCGIWVEKLEGHEGRAVNIVQPLSMATPPAAAQRTGRARRPAFRRYRMSAESAEGPITDAAVASLKETLDQAWALYSRLLAVGRVVGVGMFLGREAARVAIAGGLEIGLAGAAKTVCVLSHAERVYDLCTAVEEAVLASSDPPTPKELAVVYMRAFRLADACAAACEMLEEPG